MTDKNLGQFSITEPESAANTANQPEYPYNNVTRTNSGHYFEMDDTPDRERVRLQHRTGTFVEMHPDGTQVNHIFGEGFSITEKDGYVLVKGNCSIVVMGDAAIDVKGDLFQHVGGDMKVVVDGDYDLKVNGETNIVSGGDVDIMTNAPSSISLISTDVLIDADTRVNGDFSAEMITSTNSITAGTGIHAGVEGSSNPLAGISTLGGISAGAPVAFPGIISCQYLGGAPGIITGGIVIGTIEMIHRYNPISVSKALYNSHIHPTPEGPSGTPTNFMPI